MKKLASVTSCGYLWARCSSFLCHVAQGNQASTDAVEVRVYVTQVFVEKFAGVHGCTGFYLARRYFHAFISACRLIMHKPEKWL